MPSSFMYALVNPLPAEKRQEGKTVEVVRGNKHLKEFVRPKTAISYARKLNEKRLRCSLS